MIPFGKPLSDIEEGDLQSLIESSVQENDRVEFKRDMYGRTDEQVREMLRDIAAMANHRGGDIYIGVDEDDDGVAARLTGVGGTGHAERIRSSCLSNIAPRLGGLQVEDVPLQSGAYVIVVRVPRSLSSPHMITHRGLNQFWKRHGRQKDKMSVEEIGASFLAGFEGRSQIERFLAQRRRRLARTVGSEHTWTFLTATPVYLQEECVDTAEERLKIVMGSAHRRDDRSYYVNCGWPSPTLWGLRAEQRLDGEVETYLEVHTTGHVEFASCYPVEQNVDRPSLAAGVVLDFVDSFVRSCVAVYDCAALYSPCAFGLTILNSSALWLEAGAASDLRARRWTESVLTTPLVYAEDLRGERQAVLKRMNDKLWNAFGYERCLFLDAQGNILE
ncbi:MAG: ATP-binding protein [Dehalococcoidia bacterium]|nr:ATP-binding protein [Dehalococcoidia bacterium]